jgi:hypothetical protein
MRAWIVLGLYLGDAVLSVMMPFSSGPFTVALVLLYAGRAQVSRSVQFSILSWVCVALLSGGTGAWLSGTPISAFFVATVLLLAAIWYCGSGLHDHAGLLISAHTAFVGVLVGLSFLALSLAGWDFYSVVSGIPSHRGTGLFLEPSHFVLYVMPLWLIALERRSYRPWLYAALTVVILTCFSATLLAFLICAFALRIYLATGRTEHDLFKTGRLVLAGGLLALAAYLTSSQLSVAGIPLHDYVKARLYGLVNPDDSTAYNLSSLVALQGIELARLSFMQSWGFGVGLGNFGTSAQVIDASHYRALINAITAEGIDIGLRDGSLLASKLIGELGILSLAIPLLLANHIRRLKVELAGRPLTYHGAFAVALICLIFVRALPYFSAPVCLAIFSLAGRLHDRRRHNERRPPKRPPAQAPQCQRQRHEPRLPK